MWAELNEKNVIMMVMTMMMIVHQNHIVGVSLFESPIFYLFL